MAKPIKLPSVQTLVNAFLEPIQEAQRQSPTRGNGNDRSPIAVARMDLDPTSPRGWKLTCLAGEWGVKKIPEGACWVHVPGERPRNRNQYRAKYLLWSFCQRNGIKCRLKKALHPNLLGF